MGEELPHSNERRDDAPDDAVSGACKMRGCRVNMKTCRRRMGLAGGLRGKGGSQKRLQRITGC